jgi:hypothetical protein
MDPDGRDELSPDDERSARKREFSRRELLRAGAAVPIVFSAGYILAACGGGGHSDKAKGRSHGDHTDASHNDTSHSDSTHTDRAHTDTAHTDAGHSDHSDSGHSDHADTHSDNVHSDTGHNDVHADTAHTDTPHIDAIIRDHRHGDVAPHDDGNIRDHRHTDTHGDHEDHGDTPHGDS